MKFNDLLEKNIIRLAPMAGVSNAPFRTICLDNGSGFVTTEEIDSISLVYNKSDRTKLITAFSEYENPIAMQLLGCDSESLTESSKILQDLGASIIDINMGCPVPKITKKGKGAALMKDIVGTAKLINSIRNATKIPLTVKIRSGWDENNINAVEFSKMLESEGVDGITVHPRSRSQRYEGNSKWSYDDAKRMIEFTKCKSVMIGRGAIGNPWVFNNSLEKLSYEEKDLYKKKTIINHLQQIKNYFPKKNLDMQIKKNLSYYAKGFYNSREIRQKIFRSSDSIENVIELFFKLFDRNVEKNKLEKISV